MASTKCLDCGKIVPDDAPNCPGCGRAIADKRNDDNRRTNEDRREDSDETGDDANRRAADRRKKNGDRRGFSY